MNTIDEAIEILQALKDGKQLQRKINTEWHNVEDYEEDWLPNFWDYIYRVKPEPREFWININASDLFVYKSKEVATHRHGFQCMETIKVREVIDE